MDVADLEVVHIAAVGPVVVFHNLDIELLWLEEEFELFLFDLLQ